MKRGEIWWVHPDPTVGSEVRKTRPGLILSNDIVNHYRRTVVVVPLSSKQRDYSPFVVPIPCQEEMGSALVDQVKAVDKYRLKNKVETASETDVDRIWNALQEILTP